MSDELVAFFWEREDAEAVAARTGGTIHRERFHGEDDDEDHPWVVLIPAGTDVDQLLPEHDGWLADPSPTEPATPPAPLPTQPKRFKRT